MEDVAYLTRLPPANISINSTHLDYIMSEGEGEQFHAHPLLGP